MATKETFARVWESLIRAMAQAGCSGQEWAVMCALMRFQSDDYTISMGVRQISSITGLNEDTVRHRLHKLLQREFIDGRGWRFALLEILEPARRGRSTIYELKVPRASDFDIPTLDEAKLIREGLEEPDTADPLYHDELDDMRDSIG